MKKLEPRAPNGMRDFLPAAMLRRQYVIDVIAGVFQRYGYEPFQTPAMELSETLMGNMGEDAEKLIFYAQHPNAKEQLALRYDLTVPLARAFAANESALGLPFRRYQIAPVWRAERPQRGRFREFYQCDADIIGIGGMEADAETMCMVRDALTDLGFTDFVIKLSNRKLLMGIGIYAGLSGEPLASLYRSIDKLDKIGMDGVKAEMIKGGIDAQVAERITLMLERARPAGGAGIQAGLQTVEMLTDTLHDVPIAMEGLSELRQLLEYLPALGVEDARVEFDAAMVRGLGYYTGPIFETVLTSGDPEERVGSVSGGGRYDQMLGLFRKDPLPVTGVSLGIERLIVIMDKRGMYPPFLNRTVVQALVAVFGPENQPAAMALAAELRRAGLRVELSMNAGKLGKQFNYADKKAIPLVALVGPDELAAGQVKLKHLPTQTEISVPRENVAAEVRRLLASAG